VWGRDLVAGALWTLAVVPAAMGFWLLAGAIAGIPSSRLHVLIAASLLSVALGTLVQVLAGFRLVMYEGPAAAYLAALAVVCARSGHTLGEISGGLMAAGAFAVLLGVLRVNRLMVRVFTPLVSHLFVLIVTLAVVPATIERATGTTHGLPGSGAAWASSAAVVAATLATRSLRRLAPYSLLAGLVAGTAVSFLASGIPHAHVGSGLDAPTLLPWGHPHVDLAVVVPFVIAAALASLNTLASGRVVALHFDVEVSPSATRRALIAHGAVQAGTAGLGNILGNVSRLDTLGIMRVIGNFQRAPLIVATVLMIVLAFIRPVVDIVALVPLTVSSALVAVILGFVILQALRALRRFPVRPLLVVALPSLAPTAVWIAIGSSLSPTVQLIANPMLWGVLLAVVLERVAAKPAAMRSPA
jgi:xanthine/uracil permease